MEFGIYESLITTSLKQKLEKLNPQEYFIVDEKKLNPEEASQYLGRHLNKVISAAFKQIKDKKEVSKVESQIQIVNKLLLFLANEIENYNFNEDLLDAQGRILEGVFDKINSDFVDVKLRLNEIMPSTRLTQSELFTGGNVGISLESELKKEIRSADRIDLLVSFIKWKAIVILKDAFQEFTERGGKLRVITTTYMGATDAKAIDELSKLKNTEIKVSYNNSNERLHAKAYLFFRNSGFHTGYIGSSNFSRSALTDGLEWNVKVTTQEIPHIIDKFRKTFESYWLSPEFELYNSAYYIELSQALTNNKFSKVGHDITTFFNIKPYHYQLEILEKLQVERTIHNSHRNLVVAATGTGKTMLAAFDFKMFKESHPNCKFLFLAHRIEILQQAMFTFQNVLKDRNFGELMGDGYKIGQKNAVFATIQTFNNIDLVNFCDASYYDYIIVDEVHHAQAKSYQKVIQYFNPKILLGLTATPERMDGKDVLQDFNYRIAAEIRLPDALNNKILCPFQYFGLTDSVDYSKIKWEKGRYNSAELSNVLTANDIRVRDIIQNLYKYTKDPLAVSCIGFCVSKEHAVYMSDKFNLAGLKSAWLNSDNSVHRKSVLDSFIKKEIQYLFVVDMFNEGVDIPQIDTVMFLRPTESLTIFLQQLGRGLRLHDGKDVLTVLDFVGQSREEYDFENKFRALIGKTNSTVAHEIERDFPNLPLGSSIVLERKAKEYILENIKKATNLDKRQLLKRLIQFKNHTNKPLSLANFLAIFNLKLSDIYKNNTFTQLKAEAFQYEIDTLHIDRFKSMLGKKWIVTHSLQYFKFILKLYHHSFDIKKMYLGPQEYLLATMFYYDFYQKSKVGDSLEDAILEIGKNKTLVSEMLEYIEVKIDQLDFEEIPCDLSLNFPLQIHARYTREQILVALGLTDFNFQSNNREGVAFNKRTNVEALFINLMKTEEDFSPTTLYDDYAINEYLFHWQSQNSSYASDGKGYSYIKHAELGKKILLFVRESPTNVHKFTQGYVFLGPANFVDYEGSRPMSIKWRLDKPIPNYLWKDTAKMLVG